VSAHELRNLASLERLRLAFEEMLVESYSASARRRAQIKAASLIEMVDNISKKHDELKKYCNGREDYKLRAEEAFERIFEDTMREIETLNVSLRNKRFFTE
jgi:Ni,Fe-hydrogenase III component G